MDQIERGDKRGEGGLNEDEEEEEEGKEEEGEE